MAVHISCLTRLFPPLQRSHPSIPVHGDDDDEQVRSVLPTMELDAAFEAKEEIALEVKNALKETMSSFGYQILQCLVTDLNPDGKIIKTISSSPPPACHQLCNVLFVGFWDDVCM